MSGLVSLQTLRGTAGVATMEAAVRAAVAKAEPSHTVEVFDALPANTKGMQLALSLWAALARANGATAIRLGVHQGTIALCGTKAAIEATKAAYAPTYNAVMTATNNAYTGDASQGSKMSFTNGYACGLVASLDASNAPAAIAYGLGGSHLHAFPAPGNGTAYGQGFKAKVASTPAPAAKAPAPAAKATKAA